MLTSRCDSDFQSSKVSFNGNRLNGVDLSSNCLDTAFERTEEKFYGFRQTVWAKIDVIE